MRDPYTVLGLARTATPEEIKTSYRRLAKRYHPDSNPEDPQSATQFQDIQGAYTFLKDQHRRHLYDRGEIDATGTPRHMPFPRRRHSPPPKPPHPSGQDPSQRREEEGEDALFSELFASLRRAKKSEAEPAPAPAAGRASSAPLALSISFEEAVTGTRTTVDLPSGKRVVLTIPPGVEDAQLLRLKNQEEHGRDRADKSSDKSNADILVRVSIEPHERFTRCGLDIVCDLAVSLSEAVLGGKVRVPTLQGEVVVSVPPGSNTGTVLKLRGRGVRRASGEPGDQLVTLRIVLHDPTDPELVDFVRDWAEGHTSQVRR